MTRTTVPRQAICQAAVLVLVLACSCGGTKATTGSDGPSGDQRLFVPEGLPNTNVDGHDEGLTLIASTLVQETAGPALYAAVRNDMDTPACEAGMTTDFYDKAGERVTSAGSVLYSGRLYRLGDGTIISCIDPGQVAMAASTDLPSSMVIDDLGALEHLFPAFIVQGITPIAGLTTSDVRIVDTSAGRAYTGRLQNGLDVAVSAPRVMIFPLNRVGRPLGVATSQWSGSLAPGESWTFETSAVTDVGVDHAIFPSASIAQ
jgi:hypothetical protein